MVDFSDVVAFAEAHRRCGQVTPAVNSEPSGAYMLTLRCGCGATHERRVSAEDAAHAPVAASADVAAPVDRPAPPRVTPSPELLRAMQDALEADDEALAAQPTPTGSRGEHEASATLERDGPRLTPSPELEAVLRAAIDAEDAAALPTASPPPPAPKRVAPAPPPIVGLESTVRAAVRDHDRLRGALDSNAAVTNAPGTSPKPHTIWFAVAAVAVLAAVGAAVYIMDAPDADVPPSGVVRTVR
jgi:hypothetical protein